MTSPHSFQIAPEDEVGGSLRHNPTWSCKIGMRGSALMRSGDDAPMRRAVEAAFESVTGVEAEFNFSGWGAKLDEPELAVVENRKPSEEHHRAWLLREAAPDMLAALHEARAVLHQHYIDWDGEPEDAVPLQLARAKCDAAIASATGGAA